MGKEIKQFFSEIQEKTGINFAVFDINGEHFFGDFSPNEKVENNFVGIFSNVALDITLFKFTIYGNEYIGRILGAGKVERNYAGLFCEIIDSSFKKSSVLDRDEFIKALLFDEIENGEIAKYERKFAIKDGYCTAIIVSSNSDIVSVKNVIDNYGYGRDLSVIIDDNTCALIKFADETTSDYCSFTEFAEYIVQSVKEEMGINTFVTVGGIVKNLSLISLSFSQASETCKMANCEFGFVYSYKEFMTEKILQDLPTYKLKEYFDLLCDPGAEELLSDEDIIKTAEEFLENNLHQSETARKLFLHRNTLNYRLDKIEKATGLDIRRFSDAVSFKLILLLKKMVK